MLQAITWELSAGGDAVRHCDDNRMTLIGARLPGWDGEVWGRVWTMTLLNFAGEGYPREEFENQ